MDKQRAIREVIVHHDLALQRVKDEISALNGQMFKATPREQEQAIPVTLVSLCNAYNALIA